MEHSRKVNDNHFSSDFTQADFHKRKQRIM